MFRLLISALGFTTLHFSKPSMPAPMPVPVAPSAPSNTQAVADRQAAQNAALHDAANSGVRQNMFAGKAEGDAAQAGRGLLNMNKRKAAAQDLMG